MSLTLTANIDAHAYRLQVTGTVPVEIVHGYTFRLDDELLRLTGFVSVRRVVDRNKWFVERGSGQFASAAHTAGATIKGALDGFVASTDEDAPDPFASPGGGSGIASLQGDTGPGATDVTALSVVGAGGASTEVTQTGPGAAVVEVTAGGGSSVATTDLDTADILALRDTPVELVPAQGAGKVIVPLRITYETAVTSPFVGVGSSATPVATTPLYVPYTSPTLAVLLGPGAVADGAVGYEVNIGGSGASKADAADQPMTLSASADISASGLPATLSIDTPGTGYSVDDILGDVGLMGNSRYPTIGIRVTSVDGDGAITGIAIDQIGEGAYAPGDLITTAYAIGGLSSGFSFLGTGTGYAPGDTGTVDGGNDDAGYTVETVTGDGVPTGFVTGILSAGTGYQANLGTNIDPGNSTTPTSGGGSGMRLQVETLDGAGTGAVIAVDSVTPGDGTMRVIVEYTLLDLP